MPLPQHPTSDLGWSLEEPQNEDNGLSIVERRMLERGKKEHRETTQATTRALQVNARRDLAKNFSTRASCKYLYFLILFLVAGGRTVPRNGYFYLN
jgi:hypothetical protein